MNEDKELSIIESIELTMVMTVVEIMILVIEQQEDEFEDEEIGELPVCFQCEEDCDTCKETNECDVEGDCSTCQFEEECWEGKMDESPMIAVDPAALKTFLEGPKRIVPRFDIQPHPAPRIGSLVPPCFNCKEKCVDCHKVDDPKYCLQCGKCYHGLKIECTVYNGTRRIEP
jgi:hypothetical protein